MMHWELYPGETVTLVPAAGAIGAGVTLVFRARDTRSAFFRTTDGKEILELDLRDDGYFTDAAGRIWRAYGPNRIGRYGDRIEKGDGKYFTRAGGG
jgi:hypothetical protein